MYIQSRARQYAQQRSGASGMIEMYVCHDDPFDTFRIEARLADAGQQRFERTGRPGLDKRQCVAVGD